MNKNQVQLKWHYTFFFQFLNILALSLLAIIMRNPQMMEELENSNDYNVDLSAPALPTPLSKVDPPYAYRDHSIVYRNKYREYRYPFQKCLTFLLKECLNF